MAIGMKKGDWITVGTRPVPISRTSPYWYHGKLVEVMEAGILMLCMVNPEYGINSRVETIFLPFANMLSVEEWSPKPYFTEGDYLDNKWRIE